MSRVIETTIVGMNFRGWNKEAKQFLMAQAPFTVDVEREPDNDADENAILFSIPRDAVKLNRKRSIADRKRWEIHAGEPLGYLRRGIAEEYAPLMDAGELKLTDAVVISVDAPAGEAKVTVRLSGKAVA